MEKAPGGTSVGVADPYDHVDRCDHVTDDGRCWFALDRAGVDPAFADERSADDFRCPVVGDTDAEGLTGPWQWADCKHFQRRNRDDACYRCGLEARPVAHDDARPLLEEHHLSYADGSGDEESPDHEITVYLCRWCHAKVHGSWAALADDANPDPEAIAEREGRLSREQQELSFETAADRYEE